MVAEESQCPEYFPDHEGTLDPSGSYVKYTIALLSHIFTIEPVPGTGDIVNVFEIDAGIIAVRSEIMPQGPPQNARYILHNGAAEWMKITVH